MNFDGSSDSKPTLETNSTQPSTRAREPKPSRLRRLMSISSKTHKTPKKPVVDEPDTTSTLLNTISPRPTTSDLWPAEPKKQHKRSLSAFLLSKNSATQEPAAVTDREAGGMQTLAHLPTPDSPALSLLLPDVKGDDDDVEGTGHWPVAVGTVCQTDPVQTRKDSAVKSIHVGPVLPSTRNAALTSHPVSREDVEYEKK
ncbi:hypothetical protein N0V94_001845 [Neodidymelliopsis sp. IMI 364377]|nr:hypothetical protein N0V94_001845 [Neodidymelliopsis sp. IMI 364377]